MSRGPRRSPRRAGAPGAQPGAGRGGAMHGAARRAARLLALVLLLAGGAAHGATLPAAVERELATARYVYVASTRKDGSLGRPAEIWFLYHQGAVWVGTPPTSWRVRRIRAGRPAARIWVGSPQGPSFAARGEVVRDTAVEQLMLETFARKYPEGWPAYAERFRHGFRDGSRVLVKYTPVGP